MNQALFPTLLQITRDLRRLDARWALAGGLAVAVWAEARTTRDVDLVVAVDRAREVDDLVHRLRDLGWRELPKGTIFQRNSDRLAVLRIQRHEAGPDGVVVDLLFGACGIEREIVQRAELTEVLSGTRMPVVRPSDLAAMKVLAWNERRPQDFTDLQALLARSSEQDLIDLHQALELISRRLPALDKDLHLELARVLDLVR